MPRPGQILLSTAAEQYLTHRRGRYSPATVHNDQYVLRRFVRAVGDVQVQNLRPEKVDAWFASLLVPHTTADGIRRDGVGPIQYNNLRARVQQFSRYCQTRGLCRVDWLVHTPALKVPRRQHQQIGSDLLWAMIDSATDPRDRALLAFCCNTGCRAAEIKAIRVGDLDLQRGEIRLWISKTQQEDVLPLAPDLAQELGHWLTAYALGVGRVLDPADFLFPGLRRTRITGREQNADGVWRVTTSPRAYDPTRPLPRPHIVVQAALRAVGLPTKGEGCHSLRRAVARLTFDTLVADTNVEAALRTVSSLMHHSSTAVTESYLGLSSETLRRDDHLRRVGVLGPRPTDAVLAGKASR